MHGPGLRENAVTGTTVSEGTDSGSKDQSRLVALATTLLARGASKVWVLGGGAAAVIRRCEILQASVRFDTLRFSNCAALFSHLLAVWTITLRVHTACEKIRY